MTRLLWFSLMALAFISRVQGQQATPDSAAAGAAKAPQEAAATKVEPPDVYRRIAQLRGDLDLLRLEMGRPQVNPPPIRVEEAAPREVYFQALTLFQKAKRLGFEHTREQVEDPQQPRGEIQPKDVYAMIVAASERVATVKESLGVTEESEAPAREESVEHSQVFHAILSANREINDLLDRQFAPGDVYQEVSLAIAYAARLLDSPGEVSTPPEGPPLERRKRPADVYRRLIGCFEHIHKVGDASGISMLNLIVEDEGVDAVQPSDVYDVASLLVAELAHIHAQRRGAARPRRVVNPGRKLPSHVYQRIGILCQQVETLMKKAESDPDWLTK